MEIPANICDQDLVHRFLAGELSEAGVDGFEVHLENCGSCRRQLEDQTAFAEEWNELQVSLRDRDESSHFENLRLPADELESYRRLLGPTDDPRMMGRVGTYEVTGLLGRGGMGLVFKALDPALNRYVAIKLLAPVFLASGTSKQRFVREAQSAAAVVHEHVVGIHAISEWQGIPYLVMSYVRGGSLQTRLAARGQLSLREVLRIGMQIASGLAAAHAQGLIHRDIKPANILLENDVDRVMITDFGLARAIDDVRLTGTNTLLGTPEYMSPEQTRDEILDYRTDLFSLGCVLYEASTGRSPFRSSTSYGAIRKVNEQSPRSVRSLVPDLPEWFAVVIDRLLQKKRDARFSSAGDVATLLKHCLAHVEHPHLAPLPKSLIQVRRQGLSSPLSRRIVMATPWIVTALVGTWILAQIGLPQLDVKPSARNVEQTQLAQNAQEEQPAGQPAAVQPEAKAGKYVLKVRKADAIDQLRLAIKPAKPEAMFQGILNGKGHQQTTTNSFEKSDQSSGGGANTTRSSSGFTSSSFSGGSVTPGGKFARPNLGVVFEVPSREKVIFELENVAATDDQGKAVEWLGHSPFNFYDPEFEKNTRGALVAYFQEENGTDHLTSVVGELMVTPGQVIEVLFPDGKPATKKSGEHSFTLKNLQNNEQGIQVSLSHPQLSKPRGNMFGNPEARLKAMLAQQGAVEVVIEDSEGAMHYPNGSGGGSSGGSSSGGGFSSGNIGGNGNGNGQEGNLSNPGNAHAQSNSESNFLFAPLPQRREIKSVIVRATQRTGKPQSYPFKLDLIPIPYDCE